MNDAPLPWWMVASSEIGTCCPDGVGTSRFPISRVLDRLNASTEHFEQLSDTLHQATGEVKDLLRGTLQGGRRLEIAVYAAIGITLVQLFNLVFEVFSKRR